MSDSAERGGEGGCCMWLLSVRKALSCHPVPPAVPGRGRHARLLLHAHVNEILWAAAQ